MDFFQQVFFESPFWLAIFSFLLFAAVLLARRWLPQRAARYALPVVLLVILLLFAVQNAVVTERELILQRLDDFASAIATENKAGIAKVIGQSYDSEGLDRAAIIEFINKSLTSIDIYDIRYRRRDVTVHGNHADMLLVALATIRLSSGSGDYHTGRWSIGWTKERGSWNITALRPEMLDTAPISGLSQLMGRAPR